MTKTITSTAFVDVGHYITFIEKELNEVQLGKK